MKEWGRMRNYVRDNLALIVFLASYFVLTVAGNLIYLTPFGQDLWQINITSRKFNSFEDAGSAEYLLLLILPFIVVPAVALGTKAIAREFSTKVFARIPEFSLLDFLAITSVLYAYIIFSFWQAGVIGKLAHGSDYIGAVQSRFGLLDAVGFWPQMALKNITVFMSCYAFVRALKERESFWMWATVATCIVTSLLLILLNMKWPLLVYFLMLIFAAFLFLNRRLYTAMTLAVVISALAYLLISIALLRIEPRDPTPAERLEQLLHPKPPPSKIETVMYLTITYAGHLGGVLLNRMAQPFPYYFEMFSKQGQICGTILDRLERKKNPCQPSILIYETIFHDEFAGRGTSPQPVHVTGFALNSWTGALVELVLASIVIGLLNSISALATPMTGTIVIAGGLVGYFFSQLPFEGPMIYDHGVIWLALFLAAYSAYRCAQGLVLVAHAKK